MADKILMRLKAGRQYLKTDFKIHTVSESPCADHCRVFALNRTETIQRSVPTSAYHHL